MLGDRHVVLSGCCVGRYQARVPINRGKSIRCVSVVQIPPWLLTREIFSFKLGYFLVSSFGISPKNQHVE